MSRKDCLRIQYYNSDFSLSNYPYETTRVVSVYGQDLCATKKGKFAFLNSFQVGSSLIAYDFGNFCSSFFGVVFKIGV